MIYLFSNQNATFSIWLVLLFRPVLYLPNKEFSVAVRFSPVLYELRPVLREGVVEGEVSKHLQPWEKYQVRELKKIGGGVVFQILVHFMKAWLIFRVFECF
jgi:hypothetical protein